MKPWFAAALTTKLCQSLSLAMYILINDSLTPRTLASNVASDRCLKLVPAPLCHIDILLIGIEGHWR